jgi:RNA polymerase sigma-70 factor (ECF subfamily)
MPQPQPPGPSWIQDALRDFELPLLRQALRLLGDVEAARDVVQETFLRLCRAERAQVEDHLGAWLGAVCRNLALDQLRKEMRMQSLNAAGALDEAIGPQPPPDPARHAEALGAVDDLAAALTALTANQREVMRLRFQGGLSYQEIGRATGLSVSNVGVQLHTALLRLRSRMQDPRSTDAAAAADANAADAGERSR